jgi:NADPH-dependent methylglyoxal reductase
VPGNERYLVASPERLDLRKVVNVLRGEDPEIAQRIPAFEATGVDIAAKIVRVDTSKADKVFGTEWKGAVESVRAVAKDVLNLERL